MERATKIRIQEGLLPPNFSISVSSPKDYSGSPYSRPSNVCICEGMVCFLLRPCCYCYELWLHAGVTSVLEGEKIISHLNTLERFQQE